MSLGFQSFLFSFPSKIKYKTALRSKADIWKSEVFQVMNGLFSSMVGTSSPHCCPWVMSVVYMNVTERKY